MMPPRPTENLLCAAGGQAWGTCKDTEALVVREPGLTKAGGQMFNKRPLGCGHECGHISPKALMQI